MPCVQEANAALLERGGSGQRERKGMMGDYNDAIERDRQAGLRHLDFNMTQAEEAESKNEISDLRAKLTASEKRVKEYEAESDLLDEVEELLPWNDLAILAGNVKGKRFKEKNNIQLGASLDTLCDRIIKAAALLERGGRGSAMKKCPKCGSRMTRTAR